MKDSKREKSCMLVMMAAALCLTVSVAAAQTPAQDSGKVDADKAAVEQTKAAVENATLQMNTDQASKKLYALQADAAALAIDRQAETAAEDKLKADTAQQSDDEASFNPPVTPPASPTTGAPQGITIIEPAAGTVTTPVVIPGNLPVTATPSTVTITR